MSEIFKLIEKVRLIPVVVIENASDAASLGRALVEGGLPCAEVTFRTPAAAEAVKKLGSVEGLLVGGGTVLSVEQAKQAVDSGARFVVSPGFNRKVVAYCVDNKIPVIPGICTPTEVEAALEFGLEVVKFFPAESYGGLNTLKAISAPYPMIRFVPTGGIGPQNVMAYLRFSKVLACGGSWMVAKELISGGKFDEITRLSKEAMSLVRAG